ncbi:MAG: D-glycero-beta-D-manno-heptose 1-phosphate adenylyltransferase [Phycisphaerales bacterium]
MDPLLTALAHWRSFDVLVVGDYMLDELVYGDAERLTGDAPVPILDVRHTERRPGGAANVCLDLVALGGRVRAFGITGDDEPGEALRAALDSGGIDAAGLIRDPQRPTTVKRSLIGLAQHRHPQKMFRMDIESRRPIAPDARDVLLRAILDAIPTAGVVAIEDYGKGVCSEEFCGEIIDASRRAGIPVLVDPAKLDDYSRYRGCTAITPNRTEAEHASGLREPPGGDRLEHHEALATALSRIVDPDAVVLTLDKDGALLRRRNEASVHVPTVARQVYDVTGAGDMVLAALAAGVANGLDWVDAVRLANAAAGLEVEVFGVQPIPLERIHQSILAMQRAAGDKSRTLDEALVEVSAARREGKTVVFTNGCFDILHAGHVTMLREARALGDFLIVGLNSDDSVRRLKGADRPVHHAQDRAAVLGELRSVDIVVEFEDDTPIPLLEALRPDVLVKGGDYTKESVVGHEIVEAHGGRVEIVSILSGRSTTRAIERLRSELDRAPASDRITRAGIDA